MKRSIPFALALLGAVSLAVASGYPPAVKKQLYAKNDLRGKKAPALAVEEWLTGAAPQTKGKVVVVDFWATWCGPCRELIPEMNEWHKKFKDVVFIGLSNEKESTVAEFMKSTPMDYNVAVDTKAKTEKELGVEGIPHVMVVTPDGVVRWQGFPGETSDPLTAGKLQQIIDAYNSSKTR